MIILFISYLNFSSISVDEYYLNDLSMFHNQVGGVLVDDYYYKDQYLYTSKIIVFEEWNREFFTRNFGILLRKVVSKALSKKASSKGGIIPDFEMSMKVPEALRGILGEKSEIKVNGSQSISIEVMQNRTSSLIGRQASSFPQIKLEQRLRANIEGTVGEKIHVSINHDSEAREKDNKLKIWYAGDEDDILQVINAGDIKELGGGRNQSVFGFQTKGSLGSTAFNLVAGKIESNTSSKTESYSMSSDSVSLSERDYVENIYFYTGLSELDSLISLVLFIQEQKSIYHRPANLVDINGNPLNETATFIELTSDEDYELRYLIIPGGKRFPYLQVKKYLSSKRLAIWYVYYDGDLGRIDTLGYIPPEEDDTLILAQLRSQYPDPNDPSWDFMMRNVYRFGPGNPLSVDVTIYKVVKGGDDIEIDPVSGKEYVVFSPMQAFQYWKPLP